MIVNQTPYPINFEMKAAQALTCRYGEVGRQYKFIADIDLTGLSANLQVIKPDGTFVIEEVSVVITEDEQYIVVEIPLQATTVKGVCRYDINLYKDEDLILYTAEGPLWVDDQLITEDMIESVAEVYGLHFPQDFLTVENLVDIVNYVKAQIINDEAIAEDTTWSSQMIEQEISGSASSIIDDNVTDTDTTWSSQKIEQEISGITPEITGTAEGNPIEITDAAAAPIVKCVTQITGYQEGTGTPSPDNIRPIVAYTEGEIEVRGKNLFDKNANDVAVGYYLIASTGVLAPSQSGYNTSGYIPIGPNTYYTKSGASVSADEYCFYDSAKTFISGLSRTDTTVLSPNNAAYMRFDYKASETDDIQIEKGSTATAYEPYTSTTHTTTYPSAIYRGSEDVVNGGTVTTKLWKQRLKWGDGLGSSVLGDYTRKQYTVPVTVYPPNSDYPQLCSCAPYNASFSDDSLHFYINSGNDRNLVIMLPNNTSNDFEFDIVGELATPATSTVTPTNLPIKSLSGYTHIESSTGDMEVEYISGNYQALVDLIQSSSYVYSTDEHVIGEWTDGRPIYSKTFEIGTLTSNNTNVNHNISNLDKVIGAEGCTTNWDGSISFILLQYITSDLFSYIDSINGTRALLYCSNGVLTYYPYNATITLKYLKTA